jgi:multidrug transporter EmrE-like cation transporter
MWKEILMIVFVTFSTLGSQLLVKRAVTQIAQRDPVPQGIQWLVAACFSPEVIAAVAIQGIGFIVWVVVVSRVKLGMAFAISGAFFYILIALSSWLLYGERLAAPQWLGLILVSCGVLLMSLYGKPA